MTQVRVVILDEAESLLSARELSGGSAKHYNSTVTQFLAGMDGAAERQAGHAHAHVHMHMCMHMYGQVEHAWCACAGLALRPRCACAAPALRLRCVHASRAA